MSKLDIKLLNHQYEILSDTTTKIMSLVGGYGNGKTYTACRKAIQLSFLNGGEVGIMTEPTYPMLRDILIPEMKEALEEWKIDYRFNASNSIFFLNINGKETKILCMSAENVDRLVGVNAAWIICDEFDTSKTEIAMKAFNKLLGRLRAGTVRQFVIFTTPEGFKATYKIFVEDNADGKRKIIRAKTTDNKYLPSDFIDTLKEQYTPSLLKAYLDGEFVNLSTGTIFSYFNRKTHHSDIEMNSHEQLIFGQDFNIGGCVTIVYIKRLNKITNVDEIIAVDEFESYDTMSIVSNTKDKYSNRAISFYPDASGKNRKTNASNTDIDIIRKSGYMVYVNSRNPSVKDRINITNNLLNKGILKVNTKKCPKFTKALEQHAYNSNGEPEKFSQSGSIDDYSDAGTYPLAYLYPINDTISKVKATGF